MGWNINTNQDYDTITFIPPPSLSRGGDIVLDTWAEPYADYRISPPTFGKLNLINLANEIGHVNVEGDANFTGTSGGTNNIGTVDGR